MVAFAAAGAAIAALPGAAQAHVTVQPGTTEGGGFSVVAFRVPTERDHASTTKVSILFPEDQPVGSVRTTPVPGWKVTTKNRTLSQPIEMFGEQVSEVVSQVTWTATGPGIAPGQFEDFDVSIGPLPDSGEMVFKALQTYSSGEQVNWNQVAVDESVEPEHPAPVLTIAAPADGTTTTAPASGDVTHSSDTGTSEDGTDPETAASQTSAASDGNASSSMLPVALSGAALLVSLAALFLAWRRRA
jgi:uncharacterized protein YcnI